VQKLPLFHDRPDIIQQVARAAVGNILGHYRRRSGGATTALTKSHLANNICSGDDTHHRAALVADNDKIDVLAIEKLDAYLPDIALTLLIGHHAQAYYLRDRRKDTLSDTVKAWKEYLPLGYLPLAHPSPRNQPWLVKNPWFEEDLALDLQNVIQALRL
jgi:hypothetical protein